MSKRIDHAAEAERLLTHAGEGHGDVGWGGLEDAIRGYGLATLALVEQQRIANLIALGQFRVGPDELPPFRHLVMQPVNAYDVEPTTDIAAVLGIGYDDE